METRDPAGREAELAALRERLAGAREQRGGVVLISGEAGIGKTTLAAAAAAEAKAAGFRVESGRAWEHAEAPPWFPLRSCLRALGVDTSKPPSSDAETFQLWEQVLEALVRETARAPVLWLVEDLHAADAETLDLITYLAHPARMLAFVVLVTLRSGAAPRETTADRIARISRDAFRIELAPVDERGLREIVARVSGRTLAGDEVRAWLERTGGNPLFVVECARARRTDGKLPATVVQVVLERVHALPAAARSLLELASVLGRDFAASTLGRMSDRLPAAAIDALLPALASGLIEELAPGSFRFSHAVVSEAIHESLPPDRRREGHRKAEAALALLGETPERLIARAWHALGALGVMSEDEAGRIVGEALRMLEGQGAHDRASALWRRWSEIRSSPPDAVELIRATRFAAKAGSFAEAREHGLAALSLARQQSDWRRFAEAALAIGANLRPSIVDNELVRALEEANANLGGDPAARPLACRVRARLSAAMLPARDVGPATALARRAIDEARAIGDRAVLSDVLFYAASGLIDHSDVTETLPLAEELLELAMEANDQERVLRAFARRALDHLQLGDRNAFAVDVDRILALGRAAGHPRLAWRPLLVGSMRALAHGWFEESERLVIEAEQLGRLTDDPALVMSMMAHSGLRTLARDDPEEAEKALGGVEAFFGTVPSHPAAALLRALFGVRLQRPELVRTQIPLLLRGTAMIHASDHWTVLGEAIALAGTREERETIHARLLPFEGRESHTGHVAYTYEGPIDRVIALVEASLGRRDEAARRLAVAIERSRAQGYLPWVARMLFERGRIAGDDEGRAQIQEAADLASSLGMIALAKRARDNAGSSAAVPAPSIPPPPPAAGLAIDREGELWRLRWSGRETRVKDSRGMQMLVRLVSAPGERIHAMVVAGGEEGTLVQSDAGEALDPTALRAYRGRLAEIAEELEEAEARSDLGRAEGLRREQEFLADELSRSVGLGGRVRKIGSATERARVNATRRLKDAMARIAEADPEIGKHLEEAVRTGTYCCYRA